MKVLEIYDDNKRELVSDGVRVIDKMDKFFRGKPAEYRRLYDKNLEGLKIFQVDEFYNKDSSRGEYNTEDNIIIFKDFFAIPHELIHMSTTDRERGRLAFVNNFMDMEIALVEGMTELETVNIMRRNSPSSYFFEYFCAEMISNIEGIERTFFTADGEGFVSLFPNMRDIYSLIYSLSYYYNNINLVEDKKDVLYLIRAIQNTMDSLISIELSYENNIEELKLYKEKFMDMLDDKYLSYRLKEVYPDYQNYAHNQMRKRIKTRKGIFIK